MKPVVEVCGLAKVLGKDIRQLSHGYRQRVGLGQALIHDPPILILDEPTSDLDPNEKAEVIRYIQEIGKNRTILLSTHNLNEVEAACARAIIVSKGRVVADGPLSGIRAKSGKVRYVVAVDPKVGLGKGKAPTAQQATDAFNKMAGIAGVRTLAGDGKALTFELAGALGADLRGELFQLAVQQGWMLLELRRESQTLEDVFKALTRGDERADRGRALVDDGDEGDDDDEQDDEDEDEDETGDDGADDEDDDADGEDDGDDTEEKDDRR
jgi:ABC-2 type transport system ATP-binding protein